MERRIETKIKWLYNFKDEESKENIKNLSQLAGISELQAAVLYNRGYKTESEIKQFLNLGLKDLHDPKLMKDAEKGAKLIKKHIELNNKIVNFTDFDADGWGSTVTLLLSMRKLGADIDYWVNHRSQGFGMSIETVDLMLEKYPDTKLVITTDNGIVAYEAVERLKSRGVDVIITDHHLADKDRLPAADAIINPHQPMCNYPFKDLCGAGVIWKFMMLVYLEMNRNPNELFEYIDIVSLSTVADVVPLVDENRIIVKEGLSKINKEEDINNIWLLMQEVFANYFDKLEVITSETFGFTYGPSINAMSRLHGTTEFAIDIFLDYMEGKTSREETINNLNTLKEVNDERKDMSKDQTNAAMGSLFTNNKTDAPVIVVAANEYDEGIVGIIAGRIKEKFNRPTIVFTEDSNDSNVYKGSARSIPGFHLKYILDEINEENSDIMIKYGGHGMAAGISIYKDKLNEFELQLVLKSMKYLKDEDFIKTVLADYSIEAKDVNLKHLEDIEALEPFGQGFRKPMIGIKNFEVGKVNYIGAASNHLELINKEGNLKIISWFGASQYKALNEPQKVYVIGTLEKNKFDQIITVNTEVHNIVGV